MITDISWVIKRNPRAFLPKPWEMSLCCRNMKAEVRPNMTERRFQFTIDVHSGKNWARQGTGEYDYWTHFPPVHAWCPYPMIPPLDSKCVLWLQGGRHSGLQIGRVRQNDLQQLVWEYKEPNFSQWTRTISSNIGGWLLLPPDASG